jgi:hypothetical protein
VVTEGLTVQYEPVVPTQVPPLHSKDVATGLQSAISVDGAPAEITAGIAVIVHCGAACALAL